MTDGPAIGLDVGGTKIAAGVLGPDGSRDLVAVLPTTRGDGDANTEALREVVRRCGLPAGTPVGLSLTTTLDERGRLRDVAGWLGWAGRSPDELVGRPVQAAGNDAACGAYAEAELGAGRGAADMLYVTLGTGLSHSQVTGGRVVVGAHGAALFSGYASPSRCELESCEAGTIEDVVAGPALARAWDGGTDARHLVAAWRAGDRRAGAVMRHAIGHLGDYVAMLLAIYDPEVVVVGGGLGAGVPDYVAEGVRVAGERVRPPFLRETPVATATLAGDAGWVGAALLAAR